MPKKPQKELVKPYLFEDEETQIENEDLFYHQSREHYDPYRDVGNGHWIVVMKELPIAEFAKPPVFAIFWAVPYPLGNNNKKIGWDQYGRQMVLIHYHNQDVSMFTDEYILATDEIVEQCVKEGWYIVESNSTVTVPLNMEIIAAGKDLVEEEREIIMAFQLDGLTEQQACEEYFLTKHTDYNNSNIAYYPPKDKQNELISIFGT
jgi:hypothetical protein